MLKWFEKLKDERAASIKRQAPVSESEFDAADRLDNDARIDQEAADAMQDALEDLRARHLAFRKAEPSEQQALEELRLKIITAVTASSGLESYYHEAWETGIVSEPPDLSPAGLNVCRRVALMQIELMSRAFYVLQLQRFANAPENLGWMTLFRVWGRSPRFNRIVDEVRSTLNPEFETFFSLYLCRLQQFESVTGKLPIHHPWLVAQYADRPRFTRVEAGGPRSFRGRGLYMDSGIAESDVEVDVRPGQEGIVDQDGGKGADKPQERPSDGGNPGGTSSAT